MPQAPQAPMFVREMGLPARMALYSLAALLLMAADVRYDALAALRAGVAALVHPTQRVLAWPFAFLGEAGDFFVRHGELARDKQRLEAERHQLHARLLGYQALVAENARLRSLLAVPYLPEVRYLAAEIIQAQPDPFSRRVVINRGERQGIAPGRPVVDASGLVGQVTRVFPYSSEVTLLTSREQAAPVQVLRNGLRLLASGMGDDALLEVRFLDQHADLQPGDVLMTSGIDGVYPAGIPVARVLRVEPPRHTPFARAVCQALGGVGRYRHVAILETRDPASDPATPAAPAEGGGP